ncbi:MAG: TonB family protein [Planctomycetota bacterium]
MTSAVMLAPRPWLSALAIAGIVNVIIAGLLSWTSATPVSSSAPTLHALHVLAQQPPPPVVLKPASPRTALAHPRQQQTLPVPPLLALPLAVSTDQRLPPPPTDAWLNQLAPPTAAGAGTVGLSLGEGLDEQPRPLDAIDLQRFYPQRARRGRMHATVRLELTIDQNGNVLHANVLDNDGIPEFADASVRAALSMHWTPPTRGGKAVTGRFVTAIKWQMPP